MENTQQPFPRAREKGLLTCEVADELLVYDLDRCKAHCLNSTAALVWGRCDGRTSVSEITRALNSAYGVTLDNDVVWFALEQLERARLIQIDLAHGRRTGSAKLTRRELIKRAGASAATGLPLVSSIITPTAVEAASCRGPGAACGPDGPNSMCCNGTCVLGLCT
jgi:hypothetical protein